MRTTESPKRNYLISTALILALGISMIVIPVLPQHAAAFNATPAEAGDASLHPATATPFTPCTDNFFNVKPSIPVLAGARSVAFADFDRNGIQDVITPSWDSGTQIGKVNVKLGTGIILIGNPSGYGLTISTVVGNSPFTVVTADFNLDSKPDFAVTNQSAGSVSVGLGVGDGTFIVQPAIVTGAFFAEGLDAGDFNQDGKPDLAVTVRGTGPGGDQSKLKIYYGTAGGFGSATDLNVGAEPASVRAAHLDPDGRLDLIVGFETPDPGTGKVKLIYGTPSGFGLPLQFSVGDYAISIAVGDLNRDGYNDIATANFYGNSMTVLMQETGDNFGNFVRTDHALGDKASSIAIGDINQDGSGDIAVTDYSGNAKVFLGDGDGTFTEDTSINVGGQPVGIGLTDYNLDGKPDMVTTFSGQISVLENTCPLYPGGVTGLVADAELNAPDVTGLCAFAPSTGTAGSPLQLSLAYEAYNFDSVCSISGNGVSLDMNGSGVGDPSEITVPVDTPLDAVVTIPSETSTTVTNVVASSGGPRRAALGPQGPEDVNDLALSFYRPDASGTLVEAAYKVIVPDAQSAISGALATADFDNDGQLDYLLTDADQEKVHIETITDPKGPSPTFVTKTKISVGDDPKAIVIGDYNRDGLKDFVTANSGDNSLSIYVNSALTTSTEMLLSSKPTDLSTGDLNLDGKLDLVVGTEAGVKLLYGGGDGTFLPSQPVETDGSKILAVKLADMNVDGKPDIVALTEDAQLTKSLETILTTVQTPGQTTYTKFEGAKVPAGTAPTDIKVQKYTEDAQPDITISGRTAGKVSIIKGTVNTAPVGSVDEYEVNFGQSLVIDAPGVLANDSDPEGAAITAALVDGLGNLTFNTNGSFTYNPPAAYTPSETFTYTVSDGVRTSDPITVTINLIDTAPTINAAAVSVQKGAAISNKQIATVSDAEDAESALVVKIDGLASSTKNGLTVSNAAVDNAGQVTADVVAPCGSANANFTLRVTDSGASFSEATLNVTVSASNPPVITLNGPLTFFSNNHKYTTVTMSQILQSATDDCGGDVSGSVVIEKVTSDEPDDAPGKSDGITTNDIVIAPGCRSVQLQAERDDKKNGRVYLVTLKVTDADGNVTRAVYKVSVPLSSNGNPAVEDAVAFMVNGSCP